MKTSVSPKYFVNVCLSQHFLASNLTQTPSSLISLKFTKFHPKIRAITLKESAKVCLTV